MMNPTAAVPPAPQQQAQFPTDQDIQEIQAATGYSPQRIMQDVQQTHAQSKEELYPNVFGGTGIQPDAAAIGGGYGDNDGDEGMNPVAPPDNGGDELGAGPAAMAPPAPGMAASAEPDMDEVPGRMAARAAMAGHRAPHHVVAAKKTVVKKGPAEENLLGHGAAMRKPFDVHERARKMNARRV